MNRRTVPVIVGNRFAKFTKPYPEELRAAFAFHPKNYFFFPSYQNGFWDGWVSKLKYDKVPVGLFFGLRKEIEEQLKIDFELSIEATPYFEFRSIELSDRDYQSECVLTLQKTAPFGGGIIKSATGTGKTRVAGLYFKSMIGTGCFIVDELTLLAQTRDSFAETIGEPIGIIGKSEFRPERISVATVQSLYRHRSRSDYVKWFKTLHTIFVDELHTQLSKRTWTFLQTVRPPVVFGLTATLETKHDYIRYEALSYAGPVVYQFPLEKATDQGYLTRGVVVQLLVDVPMVFGIKWTEDYKRLVHNKERNEIICELVLAAVKTGRRVVLLVEWVGHIKRLAKLFDRKVEYRTVYGAVEANDRRKAVEKFEAGEVPLLIANRVFQKGIDIRTVDFIVDATAGRDPNASIQKYGRGVRLAEGKNGLLYVDIADMGNRFSSAARARARTFKNENIEVFRVGYRKGISFDRLIEIATNLSVRRSKREEANSSNEDVEATTAGIPG